jgi:hypothetical protein
VNCVRLHREKEVDETGSGSGFAQKIRQLDNIAAIGRALFIQEKLINQRICVG